MKNMKSLTVQEFDEILKSVDSSLVIHPCIANTPTRLGSYLTLYRGKALGRHPEIYFVGVDLQTNSHVIELVG